MSMEDGMVKRKQYWLWAERADFVKYANCPAKLFGQFIDVRFPGEPSIEYQTQVFDFCGFKNFGVFQSQSYAKGKSLTRWSEDYEFRFANIKGESVSTKPFNKELELIIDDFLKFFRVAI